MNLCSLLQASLGIGSKFTWIILLLLTVLPLSYHCSHFWAATLDFTTFFILLFFAWATPFLTAWLLLCRFHFFAFQSWTACLYQSILGKCTVKVTVLLEYLDRVFSICGYLLLYNSLIFIPNFLSFGKSFSMVSPPSQQFLNHFSMWFVWYCDFFKLRKIALTRECML